jgi:hypothetical protein
VSARPTRDWRLGFSAGGFPFLRKWESSYWKSGKRFSVGKELALKMMKVGLLFAGADEILNDFMLAYILSGLPEESENRAPDGNSNGENQDSGSSSSSRWSEEGARFQS